MTLLLLLALVSPASAQTCDCVTDGALEPAWLGDPAGVHQGDPLFVELPGLDGTAFRDDAPHPFPETSPDYFVTVALLVDGARVPQRTIRRGERGALVEVVPLAPLRVGGELRVEIGYARPDVEAAMRAAIEALHGDPERYAGAVTGQAPLPPAERTPIAVRTASLGPFAILPGDPEPPADPAPTAVRSTLGTDPCRTSTLVIEGLVPNSVHTIWDRDRDRDEATRVARADDRGTLVLPSRGACSDPPLPARASIQPLGPRGPSGAIREFTLGTPSAERPTVEAHLEAPAAVEIDAGAPLARAPEPDPAPQPAREPEGDEIPWLPIALVAALALTIAVLVARRRR